MKQSFAKQMKPRKDNERSKRPEKDEENKTLERPRVRRFADPFSPGLRPGFGQDLGVDRHRRSGGQRQRRKGRCVSLEKNGPSFPALSRTIPRRKSTLRKRPLSQPSRRSPLRGARHPPVVQRGSAGTPRKRAWLGSILLHSCEAQGRVEFTTCHVARSDASGSPTGPRNPVDSRN